MRARWWAYERVLVGLSSRLHSWLYLRAYRTRSIRSELATATGGSIGNFISNNGGGRVSVSLHLGDCLEVMRELPDGCVDLAFVDLPYGLGIAGWDKQLSGTEAIDICRAKLVDGGSMYATCTAHILPTMLELMNVRRVIAWGKPNLPLRKNLNEWEWSTEYVLWETKGEPRVFNKPHGEDARDYWRIAVENGFLNKDGHKHPARKPVALLRRIIEASTQPGDTVLDPFTGSGTTAVACIETGRNFIGYEISPTYFGMSQARIAEAQAQPSLLEAIA